MIKKIFIFCSVVIIAFSFASCSDSKPTSESVSVNDEAVDLDLSKLSSTMVYSEVYNMVTTPDSYKGMKIRMKGSFLTGDNLKGEKYYACVIQDATACCQQGIQFEVKPEYSYPDDFPLINEDIEVEGIFDSHYEDNFLIIELKDCDIIK